MSVLRPPNRAEAVLRAGRPADARAFTEEALAQYGRQELAIGIRRARTPLATLPG